MDEDTGQIVDTSASVCGPTADMQLLKQSGLMTRLPEGMGDLAYLGIEKLHLAGLGASPRRKPRGKPRSEADRLYKTAFSRRRIIVENTIGRMRRYQSITQTDRNRRQLHAARVAAIAGLVNRQIVSRLPC